MRCLESINRKRDTGLHAGRDTLDVPMYTLKALVVTVIVSSASENLFPEKNKQTSEVKPKINEASAMSYGLCDYLRDPLRGSLKKCHMAGAANIWL